MKCRCILLFIIISACSIIENINAQVYTTQYIPGPVDPGGVANFALYIPDSIVSVRGIYLYLPGWQSSSLDIVNDSIYRKLVEEHQFALLGAELLGSYTHYTEEISLWGGQALITALDQLAPLSGRGEIKFVPLFLEGHSAGGQYAYHFVRYRPDKVIGFITMKGGYHSIAENSDEVRKVPGYMFIGEYDSDFRLTNLSSIFYANRLHGAPWTLAMEPEASHSRVKDTSLLFPYFRSIISLRLPDSTIPGQAVQLKEIDTDSGWLGDVKYYRIGSSECYLADKDSACWFPDMMNARNWQKFVTSDMDSSIYDCGTSVISSHQRNLKILIYPNPIKDGEFINIMGLVDLSVHYKITSIIGQLVSEGIDSDNKVLIAGYEKGLYFLQLFVDNEIIIREIIIDK